MSRTPAFSFVFRTRGTSLEALASRDPKGTRLAHFPDLGSSYCRLRSTRVLACTRSPAFAFFACIPVTCPFAAMYVMHHFVFTCMASHLASANLLDGGTETTLIAYRKSHSVSFRLRTAAFGVSEHVFDPCRGWTKIPYNKS